MTKIDKGRRQNGRDSTRGDLSVTIFATLVAARSSFLTSSKRKPPHSRTSSHFLSVFELNKAFERDPRRKLGGRNLYTIQQ